MSEDPSPKPKLGIIAGAGMAPFEVLQACQKEGRETFVFCLEDMAEPTLADEMPHIWISLGAAGQLRDVCKEEGIGEIVMIGSVRRPSLSELKPDFLGVKVLAKLGLSSLGDDGLLRNVSKTIEDVCGVPVRGAHEVLPSLLTPEGVLTKASPSKEDRSDIEKGFEIARMLGKLDIGQAAVVQRGLVLGLEAVEGTDALIARAGEQKRKGKGGVLIKAFKPTQDARFDLPSIGPETIANLKKAGLAGVAVQAGKSLLIDREATIRFANEAGLFIMGVH